MNNSKKAITTYVMVRYEDKFKWFPIVGDIDLSGEHSLKFYPNSEKVFEVTYAGNVDHKELRRNLNYMAATLEQKVATPELMEELFEKQGSGWEMMYDESFFQNL